MTKPIEISPKQWANLREQLKKDYPLSVVAIRSKTKRVLGFTDREYKDWDDFGGKNRTGGWRKNCIMLDFYEEKKRTFFILKYGNFLSESVKNDF